MFENQLVKTGIKRKIKDWLSLKDMNLAVCYTGSLLDHSGYAEANRNDVAALHLSGVDVTCELSVHTKEKTHYGWTGELAYNLLDRNIPYKIKIIHLTPDIYDNYMERGKYHIGRLMWETDRLPAGWANYCNRMGEIWATSPHMIELFRKSGVKVPMYAFPQPIDITMADKEYKPFHIPPREGFMFYSIFQWIDRKNPKLLLQTFWRTFKDIPNVSLFLKTFRLSYDDNEFRKIRNNIMEWKAEMGSGDYPKVFLCTKLLTQEEMMRIHTTGDCFVLPHRGEGWSRPIQEALLLGKPVIATARGGIHEYLQPDHYFGIDSTYVRVTEVPYIKFYTQDQQWAEADKAQLSKTMMYAYKHQDLIKAKGIVAKDYIKDTFSYHTVGAKMRARLEEINRSL